MAEKIVPTPTEPGRQAHRTDRRTS
jgi:hypothetical protein